MNKVELITHLRNPEQLSPDQISELDQIVREYPYFLSARLLLAKASKEQKDPQTKKRIASAAIYSTDRILLKKYLNGNLFFLSEPPKESKIPEPKKIAANQGSSTPASHKEESPKRTSDTATVKGIKEDKRPSLITKKPQPEIPDLPSGDLDAILEELRRDMENLKSSRAKFAKVQREIADNDATTEATNNVTSEVPKSEQLTQKEPSSSPSEEENAAISEALKKATSKTSKTASSPSEDSIAEPSSPPNTSDEENEAISRALEKATLKAEKSATETKQEAITPEPSSQEESADIAKSKQESSSQKKIVKEVTSSQPESPSEEIQKDENQGKGFDRAERVVKEPRFSRFSTRSYLSTDSSPQESTEDDPKSTSKSSKTAKETKKTPAKSVEKPPKTPQSKKSTPPSSQKKTINPAKQTSKSSKTTKKEEPTDDDTSGRKSSQQDLINNFIEKAPSIKYQRKDELSTEDLATKSGEWDANLSSEYLAEIYLHQGNKKRAIEIYHALSLKYPEKKSYFADLISKIG